jgi:hypothetical protein
MSAPQLRQLNVTYVDSEDRLLLKVSTSDEQEYRVWCTRRFTRLLLERLEVVFQEQMPAAAAVPQPARKEVAQMQHKQAVKEEAFQQPYQAEPVEYPLGEEGLLVTTLKYKELAKGAVEMHLGDQKGVGVTLNLNAQLQHQLYELFNRAAQRAQWFEAAAANVSGVIH